MNDIKFRSCQFRILLPQLIICHLQVHIHTGRINLSTFCQCLNTLWLSLRLINEVSHAYFRNAGISLCRITFGLLLWSNILEGVFECLKCLVDTSVECLDRFDTMIDFSQLKVPLIGTIGIILNRLFQYFFSLVNLLILLKNTSIAHHDGLIERILLIC